MTKVGQLLEAIPNNARYHSCLSRFYEIKREKKWYIREDEDLLFPEHIGEEIANALEVCYKMLIEIELPEDIDQLECDDYENFCIGHEFRKHMRGFLKPLGVTTYTPKKMFSKMNLIEFLQSVSDAELKIFKDYVSIDVLREVFNAKVR